MLSMDENEYDKYVLQRIRNVSHHVTMISCLSKFQQRLLLLEEYLTIFHEQISPEPIFLV
jgi:hypothetical protein